MNFKRIETFVLVATLGSFRKAAEQQYTTQPAISSRIAALEQELGVMLFDRDSTPIVLTADGKELLPFAEKVVFMADQLRQRADISRQFSGTLRLGVSETIVHTWLPTFLKELHDQLPNLDVDMTVDVTSHLRTGLLDKTFDLTFLMGPISDPGIVNVDLCDFPLVWIASPSLGLPERTLTMDELVHYPIITYSRNTKPFREISDRFMQVDGLPVRFFSSSSLSACRKLTCDGVGVSALPSDVVSADLQSGRLIQLNTEWLPSALHFTASYSSGPLNSTAKIATEIAMKVSSEFKSDK